MRSRSSAGSRCPTASSIATASRSAPIFPAFMPPVRWFSKAAAATSTAWPRTTPASSRCSGPPRPISAGFIHRSSCLSQRRWQCCLPAGPGGVAKRDLRTLSGRHRRHPAEVAARQRHHRASVAAGGGRVPCGLRQSRPRSKGLPHRGIIGGCTADIAATTAAVRHLIRPARLQTAICPGDSVRAARRGTMANDPRCRRHRDRTRRRGLSRLRPRCMVVVRRID